MKINKPTYEILSCPNGEEALSLIERIGRVAYKSEDKIDDGRALCPDCRPGGEMLPLPPRRSCAICHGAESYQAREPSSHKFVRMILRDERREKLIARAKEIFAESAVDPGKWNLPDDIVNMCLDDLRDNPAHESVIEHVGFTVLFIDNRGYSHEQVRHRLASYTQTSTRYCNYSKDRFGSEIAINADRTPEQIPPGPLMDAWFAGLRGCEEAYMTLVNGGVKPEIARDVLPQALETEIVVTANLREWRTIFRQRTSRRAHADMRAVMLPLLDEMRRRIPIVFDELI